MAQVKLLLMALTPTIVAFLAAYCYAVMCNAPPRVLIPGGLCGAIGWIGVLLFPQQTITRAFVGAIMVSLLSIIFAHYYRHPRTLFRVAGVVPLVPGATAYQSMLAFVANDYLSGLSLAMETIFSALAIAAGLMIVDLFFYPRINK